MTKATFFTSSFFLNNRQFNMLDKAFNRDDCLYEFVLLKDKFEENGVNLSTQDINLPSESQFIIYNEMPNVKYISMDKNNYLLILESKIVKSFTKPDSWDKKNHRYFKKIFTWDDNLVDNKKYIKVNYSHKLPAVLYFNLSKKEKLCTMITGNKFASHPLELYTERLKAIRWFEQNHLEEFDFYGMGWDEYCFKGILSRLNNLDFLRKSLKPIKPKHPSYRGSIKSKREVLQKYKFAICYENERDIPGYITEKIFDCFFAGCVPVYWGAPNIAAYIPSDTFIDRREFRTYDDLYSYLKYMPDKEYAGRLDKIKNFIYSDNIYPFSAECFAETLVNEILGGT